VGGAGAGSHQADAAAAVDQLEALSRQGFAELGGGPEVSGVGGVRRAAEDAD
jgi:hypothetical protein